MAVLFTFVNVWKRKNKFSGVITQIQSFASSFNGAYFHTKIMGSHHDVAELNIADSKTLHFILHAASLLNSLPIFSVFIYSVFSVFPVRKFELKLLTVLVKNTENCMFCVDI